MIFSWKIKNINFACRKNINDINGFQALMEAHKSYTIIKKKKTRTKKPNEICSYYNKIKHTMEHCHFHQENQFDNKLLKYNKTTMDLNNESMLAPNQVPKKWHNEKGNENIGNTIRCACII